MPELLLAFITGLTTGGLSCLAVQGGLLASSLASQIETDLSNTSESRVKPKVAAPILWFLLAKLIAYTLMGFILGSLGSVLQLTPVTRAVLQITIGVFMLGQALRLLNIHPIFRYFNIQPPSFITRYIRKTAKNGSGFLTPVFLGGLTVLIPCGITQIMMASAIGVGDPLFGAALLFAFTLGTTPVFFLVAYFATKLGERMEKYFMKFVAIVVLVLAFVTINTGLNLLGSPFSFERLFKLNQVQAQSVLEVSRETPIPTAVTGEFKPFGPGMMSGGRVGGCRCGMMANAGAQPGSAPTPFPIPAATSVPTNPSDASEVNQITVEVLNTGYSPAVSLAKGGVPTKLTLVSNEVYSCSLAFVIPSLNIQVLLEPTGSTTLDISAMPAGTELPYSCSMGMYTGTIRFE